MAALTLGAGSGLSGLDVLLAVRFVRRLSLNQITVYIFSTGFICRMRRCSFKCHSRVPIWANVIIDAACLFWAHVSFQTQSSRLRGQPGQQVHRVQTNKSSPMLGGDQAHCSCSYAGWNSLVPGIAGQCPKHRMFGAWFGRLSRPAQTTIGDSETR